jgi:hypothetical protein
MLIKSKVLTCMSKYVVKLSKWKGHPSIRNSKIKSKALQRRIQSSGGNFFFPYYDKLNTLLLPPYGTIPFTGSLIKNRKELEGLADLLNDHYLYGVPIDQAYFLRNMNTINRKIDKLEKYLDKFESDKVAAVRRKVTDCEAEGMIEDEDGNCISLVDAYGNEIPIPIVDSRKVGLPAVKAQKQQLNILKDISHKLNLLMFRHADNPYQVPYFNYFPFEAEKEWIPRSEYNPHTDQILMNRGPYLYVRRMI